MSGRGWKSVASLLSVTALALVAACGDGGLGPDFDPDVEAFVDLMNDHRLSVGCDRLTDAAIAYSRTAENIAFGYPTAEAVLSGWLASPGHKANIENCALTQHGVGLLESYWTHLFITP